MAYKFSKGNRGFGDITFEDDSDTGIDFEADTIKLETGGTERVEINNTDAVFYSVISEVKVALQGTSTTTAVLEDASFTGLASSDFSVSFWYYANDSEGGDVISSNTRVLFYNGNQEKHSVDLKTPDAKVYQENNAGSNDYAEYDTNFVEQSWYHIVVHFDVGDLTSGNPRLWLNGVEKTGTGYSAVGGTVTNIDKVKVYLDDGAAMQDLVFWNKLLTTQEIAEIYNSGYYIDPSTHSASANIVSWFKLGYEPEWAGAGFSAGDTLSGNIDIDDALGSNSFTMTNENEFSLLSRTVERRPQITFNNARIGIETDSPTKALDVNSNAIRIRTSQTPVNASAAGQAGEICWDSNYIYICVANNTWKRVALSTW